MVNTWWTYFVKTWLKTWWKHGEHIVKTWWTHCETWALLSIQQHTKPVPALETFFPWVRARARLFVLQNKLERRARADPTEKSFHFFLRGHSPNKTSLVNTRWKPDGIQKASFLCNKHGGTKLGELWKLGEKLVGFGHYDKLGENQGETKVKNN